MSGLKKAQWEKNNAFYSNRALSREIRKVGAGAALCGWLSVAQQAAPPPQGGGGMGCRGVPVTRPPPLLAAAARLLSC